MAGAGKAVSAYQKLQMDMISRLSVGSEHMIDEVPFLDEGYIYTQIERLKKEHEDVSRDLKIAADLNIQSDYEIRKRESLRSKLNRLEIKIAYYAVNSFQSLELCKTLAKDKDIRLSGLVQALEFYQNNLTEQAESQFEQYFAVNGIESGIFLGNKIYGKLLLQAGKIEKALTHLEYAVQLRIDDIELLGLLKNAYKAAGRKTEWSVVSEVCRILR